MASSQRPPWNIYQEQLFKVGHGLPLWHPEPNDPDGVRELPVPVSMGSVGFMRDGQLVVIFDSTKSPTDPVNQRGVPTDFKPFDLNQASVSRFNVINQRIITSRDLRKIPSKAYESARSGTSAGAGEEVKYELSGDHGALLMLKPPGRLQIIESRGTVKEYMRHNLEYWLELANGEAWNLGLKEHELMFVSGTVTTPEWLVVAMSGDGSRKKELSLSGDFGMLANGNVSVSVSDPALLATHHRAGPTVAGQPPLTMVSAPDGSSTEESSQTIFIHYWKLKWKFLGVRRLEARAGPHQLPDGGDDADVHPSVISPGELRQDAEEANIPPLDPVDYLLDFILRHPRVNVAIASDTDLMLLFPDGRIPDDIPAALQELSFDNVVSVDDEGVGMVWDPRERVTKRSCDDGGVKNSSEVPAPKRARACTERALQDGKLCTIPAQWAIPNTVLVG